MRTNPSTDHVSQTSIAATSPVAKAWPWRCLAPGIGVLGFAVALAACGSSRTSSATASGSSNSDFEVAQCMREHSVPNFPDPSFGPGGYGIQLILPADVNPDSPAFKNAAKTCARIGANLPGVP